MYHNSSIVSSISRQNLGPLKVKLLVSCKTPQSTQRGKQWERFQRLIFQDIRREITSWGKGSLSHYLQVFFFKHPRWFSRRNTWTIVPVSSISFASSMSSIPKPKSQTSTPFPDRNASRDFVPWGNLSNFGTARLDAQINNLSNPIGSMGLVYLPTFTLQINQM